MLEARLREAILGGTHKPGSLLPPERELAAGHGVTRTTDAPDPDSIQLADVEVHRELARATGNRVYVLLTNTLLNAYLPLRTTPQAPFEDATQAWKRLAPVVHAVVDRQGEDAQRAAEAYLRGTEKIMLNSLEHDRRSSAVDNSG
nr:FCD domain-containing protein [Streptomyces adustus]